MSIEYYPNFYWSEVPWFIFIEELWSEVVSNSSKCPKVSHYILGVLISAGLTMYILSQCSELSVFVADQQNHCELLYWLPIFSLFSVAAAIFAFLFKINDYDQNNFIFSLPHKVTKFHAFNWFGTKHKKTFLGLKNINF